MECRQEEAIVDGALLGAIVILGMRVDIRVDNLEVRRLARADRFVWTGETCKQPTMQIERNVRGEEGGSQLKSSVCGSRGGLGAGCMEDVELRDDPGKPSYTAGMEKFLSAR